MQHSTGSSYSQVKNNCWQYRAVSGLIMVLLLYGLLPAFAADSWEKLDHRLKTQVYQLNIGLKMHLEDGLLVTLADLSPKYHYPVFTTTEEDKGYKIVGSGSAFPVFTTRHDKTYFLTNRHVLESGEQIANEGQRFYAALRLLAEQTSGVALVAKRFQELLSIINLGAKKEMSTAEKALYQSTADAIWDTYETYLSQKADPGRLLFNKYLSAAGITTQLIYSLHKAGPIAQKPLMADLYKVSSTGPDLAILTSNQTGIAPLELDSSPPAEGQEIQVVGYPTASDQIDEDSASYYAPTFHTGRISRVGPHILEVDAPITTGNSGGPVVNLKGKVLGVVALRAISVRGGELPSFGGAVTVDSVKTFAPELFH